MKKSFAQGFALALVSLVAVSAHADDSSAAKERTAVDAALKREVAPVKLNDRQTGSATPAVVASAGGGPIEVKTNRLSATAPGTSAHATVGAGTSATFDAPKIAEPVVMRPTSRTRRAHVPATESERPALESLNPSFAKCLTEADAAVDGTAIINAAVTATGEVSSSAMLSEGGVSAKAAACFSKVVSHAKFARANEASIVQIRVAPRELRALATPKNAVARK